MVEARRQFLRGNCAGYIHLDPRLRVAPLLVSELPQRIIQGRISHMAILCRDGQHIVPTEGVVVDRARFDEFLVNKTVQAGATVRLGTRALALVNDRHGRVTGAVVSDGAVVETVLARNVIVSCGPRPSLLGDASPSYYFAPRNYAVGLQSELPARVKANVIALVFDYDILPRGYYGWVFPGPSGKAKVGVAVPLPRSCELKRRLLGFIQRHGYRWGISPDGSLSSCVGGLIPVRALPAPVRKGLFVVGDAAGQLLLEYGAGIHMAAAAGRAAAERALGLGVSVPLEEIEAIARASETRRNRLEELPDDLFSVASCLFLDWGWWGSN